MKKCVTKINYFTPKKYLVIFLFFLSISFAKAQQTNVIGIKAGNYFSVFYKYYPKEIYSTELAFSKYSDKNQISLIFINHSSLNYADTFRLNLGTGIHYDWNIQKNYIASFGFDGVIGVEYSIPKTKFIVGLQWHPQLTGYYQKDGYAFLLNYYTINVNYILN